MNHKNMTSEKSSNMNFVIFLNNASLQKSMSQTKSQYEGYKQLMSRIADLRFANAVLQWDQETYLPKQGAAFRSQQIATLSEAAHELFISDKLGDLLNSLQDARDLSETEKRNVELSLEDYSKQRKFTPAFVRKLSESSSKAFHAWIEARKTNSFEPFRKPLETLVDLKRQEADLLGYEEHCYNALLDAHDKGSTTQQLDALFGDLKKPLKSLLNEIMKRGPVNTEFLRQHFDKDKQWRFGLLVLEKMGYNFNAGRQDISEHPFTVSFNPHDVRITTRVNENDFCSMLWSCIHEGGHALYEQGLPQNEYGLPLGEACSFSIHESQSRIWENNIGRGRAFWNHFYPLLQETFPDAFGNVSNDEFFLAINEVKPSLIRTEADELTYHFHVMIRYELEKKLMEGSIKTDEIPEYWNDAYQVNLGIIPPDFRQGCLQDVHWSHGSFGYFSTYSTGSLYAAQFYAAMDAELKGLENSIEVADFEPVRGWLGQKIYRFGRQFTSEEICNKTSRKPLQIEYFTQYLTDKMLTTPAF